MTTFAFKDVQATDSLVTRMNPFSLIFHSQEFSRKVSWRIVYKLVEWRRQEKNVKRPFVLNSRVYEGAASGSWWVTPVTKLWFVQKLQSVVLGWGNLSSAVSLQEKNIPLPLCLPWKRQIAALMQGEWQHRSHLELRSGQEMANRARRQDEEYWSQAEREVVEEQGSAVVLRASSSSSRFLMFSQEI